VDYSQLPSSLLAEIMDAVQVQTEWLKVLSKRTERYRGTLLRKVKRRGSTV
jgi:hypothetical protein